MDRNDATELTNHWQELDRDLHGVGRHYSLFRRVLCESMPDEFEAAGVVELDGLPTALVVVHDALLLARLVELDTAGGEGATEHGEPQPRVEFRLLPLVSGEVRVDAVLFTISASRTAPFGRLCHWRFRWTNGDVIEFEGQVGRQTDWGVEGLDDAERVGRAISRRLGWAYPGDSQ